MAHENKAIAAILADFVFLDIMTDQEIYDRVDRVAGLINITINPETLSNHSFSQPNLITMKIRNTVIINENKTENPTIFLPASPENQIPVYLTSLSIYGIEIRKMINNNGISKPPVNAE